MLVRPLFDGPRLLFGRRRLIEGFVVRTVPHFCDRTKQGGKGQPLRFGLRLKSRRCKLIDFDSGCLYAHKITSSLKEYRVSGAVGNGDENACVYDDNPGATAVSVGSSPHIAPARPSRIILNVSSVEPR